MVTILGHVDHGKTSLLDKIRNAKVADGEAGGITQATSAFRVPVRSAMKTRPVVFIDTPGHEAFTAMRSRGANVTDIVVLVVAADDGVMPQTIESISHAKAAGVPIVVALNKIDKCLRRPTRTSRSILGQLAEHELNPTDWGGDTEVVRTSAISGEGHPGPARDPRLPAQLLELKADFGGAARGSVIESRIQEPGRGVVANILHVTEGELKVGDFIVAGRGFGRVRDITNDRGNGSRRPMPPMPVQISGLDEIPDAGDKFFVTDTLKKAQEAAEQRRSRERETQLAQPKVTLDTCLVPDGRPVDLKEILDRPQGRRPGLGRRVSRTRSRRSRLDEVKMRVLHAAVGGITESDVMLADASKRGHHRLQRHPVGQGPALSPRQQGRRDSGTYDVIYHITEDVQQGRRGHARTRAPPGGPRARRGASGLQAYRRSA